MAGDFVPIDHDFLDKPETLSLARNIRATSAQQSRNADASAIGVVMVRLFRMWRLFDRQSHDGVLLGLGVESLVDVCGGDDEFWRQVEAVGWLHVTPQGLVMPGFRERFPTTAKERMKRSREAKKAMQEAKTRNTSATDDVTPAQQTRNKTRNKTPLQNQNQNQKNKEPSASAEGSSEPVACDGSEPTVLVFPTAGKPSSWGLTQAKLAEYAESYPGVDAMAECRKALQWCRDNLAKRKTARGMPAFLARWLGRQQDAASPPGGPNGRRREESAGGGLDGIDWDKVTLDSEEPKR